MCGQHRFLWLPAAWWRSRSFISSYIYVAMCFALLWPNMVAIRLRGSPTHREKEMSAASAYHLIRILMQTLGPAQYTHSSRKLNSCLIS